VPGSVVVVHASRYLAGRVAEAQCGSTVHLLDDGFQHVQLMRDIDLLVAPPADFVSTATLPFGRFREPLDAAAAADALLVPAADLSDATSAHQMGERLRVSTAFGFVRSVPPPKSVAPVFAFAGIAKPDDFFEELERAGWRLAGRRAFPDHHQYSARDLESLQLAARGVGAEELATTSKDAVRFALSVVEGTIPVTEVALHIALDPAFRPWLQQKLAQARAA
jgi:tetraacyldisaccharide 4'-kinase